MSDHQAQRLRSVAGVSVGEEEPLSPREASSHVQCVCFACPAFRQRIDPVDVSARVACRPGGEQARSGACRNIIDHCDIEGRIVLRQQGGQDAVDIAFLSSLRTGKMIETCGGGAGSGHCSGGVVSVRERLTR